MLPSGVMNISGATEAVTFVSDGWRTARMAADTFPPDVEFHVSPYGMSTLAQKLKLEFSSLDTRGKDNRKTLDQLILSAVHSTAYRAVVQ